MRPDCTREARDRELSPALKPYDTECGNETSVDTFLAKGTSRPLSSLRHWVFGLAKHLYHRPAETAVCALYCVLASRHGEPVTVVVYILIGVVHLLAPHR
jgi:hypothetical protein